MDPEIQNKLKERAIRAAESALADTGSVGPIEVLTRMGLIAPAHFDDWKKGYIDSLENTIQGNPNKIAASLQHFRDWVEQKGLKPTEARYFRRSRDGQAELKYTGSGDPATEKYVRTHYVRADLPERKQQKIAEKLKKEPDLVVFEILNDSKCSECGVELEQDSLLFMELGNPLCLACAHLDGLEFLPSGDAALTRRATKYSKRKTVVVRFSRSRGHYERQGILVEIPAIEKAEQECVEDADARAKARASGAAQRKKQDRALIAQMTERIAELFPGCPPQEAASIAAHTAERGSGRVGRTAAGRSLEDKALLAAVTAAVRHKRTRYDALLADGMERDLAREQVTRQVQDILASWRK